MGYANYIGRVGALAVALGIGAAVGTGNGIAIGFAEDGAESTTDTNTTTGENTDPPSGAETTSEATATEVPEAGDPSGVVGSDPTGPVVVVGDGRNGDPTPPTSEDTTSTQETPPPSTPEVSNPAPPTSNTNPPPPPPSGTQPDNNSGAVVPQDPPPPTTLTVVEQQDGNEVDDNGNTAGTPALATARILNFTEDEPSVMAMSLNANDINAVEDVTPSAPRPFSGLVAIPGALVSITTNLLSAVLAPFMAPNPAAPTDAPFVWGLLAWVRRQFEQTFFNHTPTLDPVQTSLVVDENGEIHGTLGPADPDGDDLTYWTTTDPEHGTVTIDQVNRTWTYTPDAGYKGVDLFTVKVSDTTGLRIHGLLGFLQPDFGATDTATVLVKVPNPRAIGNSIALPGDPVGAPVYSVDGTRAYQLTQGDDPDHFALVTVNTADGTSGGRLDGEGTVVGDQGLVVTPDGKHAYFAIETTVTDDGGDDIEVTSVGIIDLANPGTGAFPNMKIVEVDGTFANAENNMLLSADGKRLYLSTEVEGIGAGFVLNQISVIDIAQGTLLGDTTAIGKAKTRLFETEDGSRLVQLVVSDGTSAPTDQTNAFAMVVDSHTGDAVKPTSSFPTVHSDQADVHTIPELTFSDDGSRAFFRVANANQVGADRDTIGVVNLADGTLADFRVNSDSSVNFVGEHGDTLQTSGLFDNMGTPDTFVGVFNSSTGQQVGLYVYLGSGEVLDAVFSPDGIGFWAVRDGANTKVVSVEPDGSFRRLTVVRPPAIADVLTLNADGSKLYIATTGTAADTSMLTVVDSSLNASDPITLDGLLTSVVPTPDHTKAVVTAQVSGMGGTATFATVIDLTTGLVIGSPVEVGKINRPDVLYSDDGSKAYVLANLVTGAPDSEKTRLSVIDMSTGQRIGMPITADGAAGRVPGEPDTALEFSQDRTKALYFTRIFIGEPSHQYDTVITTVDFVNSQVIGSPVELTGLVDSFVTDPARSVFVLDRSVKSGPTIVDLNGHSLQVSISNSGQVWDASVSDDGKHVYISDFGGRVVEVAATSNGLEELGVATITGLNARRPLALSPDGTRGIQQMDNQNGDDFLRVIDTDLAAPTPPSALPGPADPISAVLSQIQTTFFNRTPTLAPEQRSLVVGPDGTIIGVLGAHDAEGDRLEYSVTSDPEHGTVTIDQATGTWTYTPTDNYRGPDTFVVEASDATGFRIHGIGGFFQSDGGYTTSASVSVNSSYPPSIIDEQTHYTGEPVGPIVFSPDGSRGYQLTRGISDTTTTLTVFDPHTGELVWATTTGGTPVEGQGLVTTADGRHALVVLGSTNPTTFRPETNVYVVDLTADITDSALPQEPIELEGRQDIPARLQLSADGKRAYLVTREVLGPDTITRVAFIDTDNGELIGEQAEIVGAPESTPIETANGRLLQTVTDRPPDFDGPEDFHTEVWVFDAVDGSLVAAEPITVLTSKPFSGNGGIRDVSSDGTRAILETRGETEDGAETNAFAIIDTETGTALTTLDLGESDTDFVGDGSLIHSVTALNHILVFDATDGHLVGEVPLGGAVENSESTPDGTVYYSLEPSATGMRIVIVDPQAHGTSIDIDGTLSSEQSKAVEISADGSRAYIATRVGDTTELTVINTATKAVEQTFVVEGRPDTVGHAPYLQVNEQRTRGILVTVVDDTLTMTDIDLTTGQIIGSGITLAPGTAVNEFSFSEDGSRAYIFGTGPTLTVVDTDAAAVVGDPVSFDGTLRGTLFFGFNGVNHGIRVSADGKHGFVVTETGGVSKVYAVDLEHPGVVGDPLEVAGEPRRLVTSDDGRVAVLTTDDGSAAGVIDVNGHGLTTSGADGTTALISPDGRRVYLVSGFPTSFLGAGSTEVTTIAVADDRLEVVGTVQRDGFPFSGDPVLSADGTRILVNTNDSDEDYSLIVFDTGVASPQVV